MTCMVLGVVLGCGGGTGRSFGLWPRCDDLQVHPAGLGPHILGARAVPVQEALPHLHGVEVTASRRLGYADGHLGVVGPLARRPAEGTAPFM